MATLQCPTTLILARHGEAEYESDHGAEDGGCLTGRGRRQATSLVADLTGRRVAHVWTSTLARAVQTGEIVAASLGVGVTTRVGLEEFGCGEHAGAPRSTDPLGPVFGEWLAGRLGARIPGGESGREVAERLQRVLTEIADQHPGETVLVVSHGGILRVGVPLASRMVVEPAPLANCATIEVDVDADGWVCRSWER